MRAALALSLCLFCSAIAQEAPPPGLDKTALAKVLDECASPEKERARAADVLWMDFCSRRFESSELDALLELWSERPDFESHKRLLFALRRVEDPRAIALRDAEMSKPSHPELLIIALSGFGLSGRYDRSALLAPHFGHEDPRVRRAAIQALLNTMARFEGLSTSSWHLLASGYRVFRGFAPHLKLRVKDPDPETRAAAIQALVNISADKASLPIEELKAAAASSEPALRYLVARVAREDLDAPLGGLIVPMLADHNEISGMAAMALFDRLKSGRSKELRELTESELEHDLERKDSAALKSPLILFRLAELANERALTEKAIERYRLASQASARGGAEPLMYQYHLGATARIRAAELLSGRGNNEAAQKELIEAHFEFHPDEQVQISAGLYKSLGEALKTIAASIGGPKSFPPLPRGPRQNPRITPPQPPK